jgi:hypothetical protein
VLPVAPICFVDEFLRPASSVIPSTLSPNFDSLPWMKKIVGVAPPTVAPVADQHGGVVAAALTSASQKQDAILYLGDERSFTITSGVIMEARVKLAVLPTDYTTAVIGLAGDWADNVDTVTYAVWFEAKGSGLIRANVDDNATDTSTSTATTVLATEWHIYRIDATDVTSIRFYIDGVPVATSSTFAYTATGANATLQPFIGCAKNSGTGVGTAYVDYVRIWSNR